MPKLPSLIFAIVFLVLAALTQLLAWQQYDISQQKQKNELVHEAAETKDRFRNILFNDIAAANTLAIIYKQYGVPAKFDSIASQILSNSRYAEALQITENGIVKNAYPDASYKSTIGTNVNADTVRKAEEARAADLKNIYFAGPRRLRFGDTGILGKVPIIVNSNVKAVATVLTRLPAIKKELDPTGTDRKKFAYQLLKTGKKDTTTFLLSDVKPAGKTGHIDLAIPEGDWLLRTSYGEGYAPDRFPYELSGIGILLSLAGGLLAYRKAREPYKLNKIIEIKTAQSNKANKELNLLNQINDIILRVDNELQLYKEACECITTTGNYELAWICYKPDSGAPDQALEPLVAIGATEYLNGARIVLDDPELCNGPTATALNTGKAVFNNDIANSTYSGRWKKSAVIFNICSSASLPLNLGDGKSGVLSLYSRHTNAFDEHETSTLNRLAANLSIAVQHIRNRSVLAESENRFRSAFEDSAIGMGITSIEEETMGRWIKVNRSLCEMLGYTENELLSLTFMQITHPDDLKRDIAAQDRILQEESDTYRMEKRYMHKDGSIVWINLNVSLIKNKDKQPIYLVAQVENITEKIESQNKYQNLVENFIVGVYIIQNDKIVYINQRIAEDMGYTQEEIINEPFEKFIYQEDVELVRENIRKRIEKDIQSIRYEARIIKKDGQPLWYEILGGSTLYQGAPALLGTMVNITERKAIYDELEKSEANLKSIFETTDVSYLLLDTEYKIIALNQHMKDIYIAAAGVELYEGGDLMKLMPPQKLETAKMAYDRVMKNNEAWNYETTYIKDEVSMHFLANVKPINDGSKVIGLCISSIDITERINYINAIEAQNKRLLEISWIQSHIIRAPLSRILGLVPMLEDTDHTPEEQKVILGHILTSANELDEVIKTITDKSKIEDFQLLKSP